MPLKETIETEYKNALKAKDKTKISTYRLILSSIKDLDISNRSGPNKKETDDEDIKKLLKKMVKQRAESIDIYKKNNRTDLLEVEQNEYNILTGFLPNQLGEEETKKAISTAKNIFEKKEGTANLPVISYNNNELAEGVPILECLTNNNYLLSSKGEARRLIRGSGVKINNTTVSDENMKINNSLFVNESRIKLSVGKKKHIILEKK